MNQLQMLKRALIAYVNSMKIIWSAIAHPLSIVSKRKGMLKDYRIYGNSVQDGTPTPEAPIEIQSVGELVTEGEYAGKYKIPVTVRGKNYFDVDKIPFNKSTTQPYNNGLTAKKATVNRGNKIPISLPVGRTIYVTMDVVDSMINGTVKYVTMGFFNDSNTRIGKFDVKSTIGHQSYSVTLDEDISYIQFYFQANNSSNAVGDYVTMDNIMLRCEGDDTFEPYIEPQNFDIYLEEPLRKIGEYEDYIDFEKGVIVRNVGKKVFDGTETFTNYAKCLRCATKDKSNNFLSAQINCLSNFFEAKTWDILWENVKKESGLLTVGVARSAEHIICSPYSTLPTIAEWKAQLAAWYEEGNPFTVWYAVLTTEEAIELPEIPTFKGTTIYEVDTTIKPSGIEVCYYE